MEFDFLFFSFFLLAHCGRMSERSKESPAEIGYLSIYVYAYILGMTRNAARLIENINDFSRFFSRTNDTYASGYWYVVQDTWQLDVSAKNVWKPLSCVWHRYCKTEIRAASLRSDLEPMPHSRSISWIFEERTSDEIDRRKFFLPSASLCTCMHFWMEIFHSFTIFSFRHLFKFNLFPPSCYNLTPLNERFDRTQLDPDNIYGITRVVLTYQAVECTIHRCFHYLSWVCTNNRYPSIHAYTYTRARTHP